MPQDVAERLARIEAIVSRMEQRLLGNGQPGEIDLLKQRTSELEEVAYKAKGAFWVISAVVTFITSGGLIHIFKAK